MGFFGLILAKNIKIYKRPPLMTLLGALGAYWNEYGNLCFWRTKNYQFGPFYTILTHFGPL